MDILRVQRHAEDNAFDSQKFTADFPTGRRECQFLDAYMGLFKVDGLDGFVTVKQIDAQFPDLHCEFIA